MSSLNDLYPEETDTVDSEDREPAYYNKNNTTASTYDEESGDDHNNDAQQQQAYSPDEEEDDEINLNVAIAAKHDDDDDDDQEDERSSRSDNDEISKESNSTSDAYLGSIHESEDRPVRRGGVRPTKINKAANSNDEDIDEDFVDGYNTGEDDDEPESFHDEDDNVEQNPPLLSDDLQDPPSVSNTDDAVADEEMGIGITETNEKKNTKQRKAPPTQPSPPAPSPLPLSSSGQSSNATGAYCCLMIPLFGAFVAGSFIGSWLAFNRDYNDDNQSCPRVIPATSPTLAPVIAASTAMPTNSPTILPTAPATTQPPASSTSSPLTTPFSCPESNIPLEFRITFDARPGEVGLFITDPFGIDLWNFPTRSFRSQALMLRENFFTLCLNPTQNYTMRITDEAENGLVSETLGVELAGNFVVTYGGQVVTTYTGICPNTTTTSNETGSGDSDDNIPALECGAYCQCTYQLAVNASSGACSTNCTQEGPSSLSIGLSWKRKRIRKKAFI